MSDFKAKMYQIQFRLGLRPRPPTGLRGLLLRGGDGKGRGKGKGGDRKGRGREGEERGPHPFPPNPYFWIRPWIAQDDDYSQY